MVQGTVRSVEIQQASLPALSLPALSLPALSLPELGDAQPTWRLSIVMTLHDHSCFERTIAALANQTIALCEYEVLIINCLAREENQRDMERLPRDLARRVNLRAFQIDSTSRAAAWNLGIQQARGNLILLLADDFVPEPQVVAEHLRLHERHPQEEVVGIGPGLFSQARRQDPFRRWLEDSGRLLGVSFTRPEPALWPRFFYGANASLKRALIQRVGEFQEVFQQHDTDDYEMGLRLLSAGARLNYLPEARCEHDHPLSFGERRQVMYMAGASGPALERLHPEHPPLVRRGPWTIPLRYMLVFARRLRYWVTRKPKCAESYWASSLSLAYVRGYYRAKRRLRRVESGIPSAAGSSPGRSPGSSPSPSLGARMAARSVRAILDLPWLALTLASVVATAVRTRRARHRGFSRAVSTLCHEVITSGLRDLSTRMVRRVSLARDVLRGTGPMYWWWQYRSLCRVWFRVVRQEWRKGQFAKSVPVSCRAALAIFARPYEKRLHPIRDGLSAEQSREVIAKCSRQPRISLIVPIRPGSCHWLEDSIRSVCRQHYRDWELILVGAASADAEACDAMQRWPLLDARIVSCRSPRACSTPEDVNLGLATATGSFVGFLEPGDELAVDALTWFVHAINARPSASWLYSDEDAIDEFQLHHSPHFKPDFSPEYLLSSMCSCGPGVYAIEQVRSIGGCRVASADAWHHDLALRLSEVMDREYVVHVPRLLYHRRVPVGSPSPESARQAASTVGRRMVAEALQRRDIPGSVTPCPKNPAIFQIHLEPRDTPRVAVVIPTRNALDLLRPCVDSLRSKTSYPNYSLVVIDNQSDDPALHDYLRTELRHGTFEVFDYPRPFSHSQMHNELIPQLEADFVMLVNNDVKILSDRWLEQMVATVQLSAEVAGVGALLRYPDGGVQHGGVILGLFGVAGHAHRFLAPGETGYFGRCGCLQEVSAATAAFLLLRRDAFLEVGGFRADRYPNSFNDVDLWLRLRQRGYRCLYNPQVTATHYETATRRVDHAAELEYHRRLLADWRPALVRDPFYNPNLSVSNESFYGFRHFSSDAGMRHLATPERAAA